MLCYPSHSASAAARGLLLWYQKLVPVLLPFSILSNILLASDSISALGKRIGPVLQRIYPLSADAFYPLIAGFLFGFPMGGQITSQMIRQKKLSHEEGLCCFCISNNIGPAFLQGVLATQAYFIHTPVWLLFLLLYLPPLMLGRIWLFTLHRAHLQKEMDKSKKTASKSQITFEIIDAGILNGFEILTRIGGYVMLFSILADMLQHMPYLPASLQCVLIGCIEITNGIHVLAKASFSPLTKQILALSFLAFGGLSGFFQASSFAKDASLSMKSYFCFKLLCTSVTAFCSLFFFSVFPSLT